MAIRSSTALPYRLINPDSVVASEWLIDPTNERCRPLPAVLPEWDYQMDLQLQRQLRIDRSAVERDTGLATGSPLAISVRWGAVPSHLRGSAAWLPLRHDQTDVMITVDIPGERLGGRVELETMIVLAAPGASRPGTAHRPGSCIWREATVVWLQGSAPLFPVALVPFSKSVLPAGAAWFVELGQDLEAAAMGSIQLLLNEEHDMIRDAIKRQSAPLEVDRVILSALRTDVARAMIEHALSDDAFGMERQFDAESLGGVMQGLLRMHFGIRTRRDLEEIKRTRDTDMPMFTSLIQDSTDFLAALS